MSLLISAFRLALKAKMVKDGIEVVKEVLPEPVKNEIGRQVGKVGQKVQETTADLLARHAPEFSKKVGRAADPEAAQQADTLKSLNEQMQDLARTMKQAQQQQGSVTTGQKKSRKKAGAKPGSPA